MLDWETYRTVLYGLYMTENKTLRETMEHMESSYGFKATSAQYQAQFKKWKFQKNVKKSDWVYVSQKLTQRKQRESVVFHDGVLVPHDKVKKNISRYVHPNDAYKQGNRPPSPGYITVCSPIPDPVSQPGSPQALTHRRRLREGPLYGPSSSKRYQLMGPNDRTFRSTHSTGLANHKTWQNAFCVLPDVDLSNLPYFQLRAMFDTEDVKKGFQEILTLNDPVHGNIMYHFSLESSSPMQNHLLSDSPYAAIDMDMDDDWKMLFINHRPKPKPFGFALLKDSASDNDGLLYQQRMIPKTTNFLANLPCKDDKELQVLRELLLGPPTIEAARRFVEVGIYIVSNHLFCPWEMDNFIETMLQSIPWLVLRPILAVQAPSIQAFTESVFLHAITSERHQVVEHLLLLDSMRATVVSSGAALVAAVRTSSCKLVSLILDAEACPNKIDSSTHHLPLIEARTVHVAQLLLRAGADINAKGIISFTLDRHNAVPGALGPAVVAATASGNIDLVQFLIGEGAHLNTYARGSFGGYSAAMVAVCCGSVDILHMLLRAGSRPNEISETRHGTKTLLQKAAVLGDIKAVRLLIKYGGDANAPAHGKVGMTALQAAVSRDDIQMVKLLLANGADVNTPSENDDRFPQSLLTAAVERNNLELVRTILDAGADFNVPSFGYYGCTALESAMCLPGGSDIRDLLVARGAQHDTRSNNEYAQIQLRSAVWEGDLARIRVLLQTGLKIDMDPYDDSPYRYFYHSRYPERRSILQDGIMKGTTVFQVLFDIIKNYNEDIDFHPLLVDAARASNVEIQRKLLDAGANINSTHCREGRLIGTPLMFAVRKNDLETVQFLHDKGADVNVVVESFHLGQPEEASTALQISFWPCICELGSLDVYHFLRLHGATINARISRRYGLSELASAVMINDLAIVQELLDTGADVNSPPAEFGGRTALQAAAYLPTANVDMIQLLLQKGADVNALPACQYGITALGAAASGGHFQIALILLKAGADVNAEFRHPNTTTSLREAASYGRLDMVYLLLKAGADLHLPKDERYVKATEAARKSGHIAIATILENWKVDEVLERSLRTTVSQNQGESLVIELE